MAWNIKPMTGLPEQIADYVRGDYLLHDAIAFAWDTANRRGAWSSNVKPTQPPEYYSKIPGLLVFVWDETERQWKRYA